MSNFKIDIKSPCSENFKKFPKTETGGFCSSCNKNVIDFTKMNHYEIKNTLDIEKNICGRFHDFQLGTYNTNKTISTSKSHWKAALIAIGFTSLFASKKLVAQDQYNGRMGKVKLEYQNSDSKNNCNQLIKNEITTIQGIVTLEDYENEPAPGVAIIIKGTDQGTVTDFDGYYSIDIKLGDTLLFQYLGYETKEITIDEKFIKNKLNINLKLDIEMQSFIVGEVEVNQLYSSKKSLWQRFKNLF